MTSKFQNKIKQMLYRPAKKNPQREYVVKKLKETEKTLNETIGGIFKKSKNRSSSKSKDKDKKEEKS